MKKPVFNIIFLINMCLISNLGFSTNYYVDAISGSDSYDGTSPTLAWETIDKVNYVVFQPGDSILFHRGQSWTGNIFINYTGSSSQPIVFSSYGSGDYPTLKGSTEADSTNYWIYTGNNIWESVISFNEEISVLFYNTNDSLPLRAKKESVLSSLDNLWEFYYDPVSHKVSIYSPSDNPADLADGIEIVQYYCGIHIEDVCSHITISKFRLKYYTNDGIYAYNPGAGLIIDSTNISNVGGSGSDIFHGNGIFIHFLYSNDTITIINNETYNIWNIGIFVPAGPSTISTLYGSRICNNNLIMTGGSAIGVRYSTGVEVSDNNIYKASVYIPDRCGIGLENCDYLIVTNNTISEAVDDFSSPYSGWLSAGIYTFGVSHSKFYYNIVSDGMVGIHLDDDDGTYGYTSTANEVCYNLCYDFIGIGIMIEQENDSTLVYNNTVYNCLYAGISFRGMWAGNSDHCSVKNNIVFNPEYSNNVVEIANIGIDFKMDYNCFYHADPSANLIHWIGNNYLSSDFNSYQNISGQDSNSLITNPLFVSPSLDEFALNSSSPCIDAGTHIGLDTDITGQSVPINAMVDIGAYEYNSVTGNIIPIPDEAKLPLLVSPNPFSSGTTITINENLNDAMLRVYNSNGKQVKQMNNISGQMIILHLDNLPSWLYYIQLSSENVHYPMCKLVLVDN
ncbi:MAG: hypothetical protein C0596_18995 [Marinilabiliales bacterium]|nr:MAG: hypothetical protein C0596_18995 [Marinilabiliales bacterium]